MSAKLTFIIGADPGDTTGVAIWSNAIPWEVHAKQIKADAVRPFLAGVVDQAMPATVIFAVERFVLGRNTVRKKNAAKTAPAVTQDIRSLAAEHDDMEVRLRGASDAKHFCTNARLHQFGWYQTGKGHANDAIRQVVLCIAECFPDVFNDLLKANGL